MVINTLLIHLQILLYTSFQSDSFDIILSLRPLQYYTVSQKNIPDIFSCNSRKHCRIFIICGTHVTEKVNNQEML